MKKRCIKKYPDGGKTGMMKARMALDAEFGNPAAKRMVSPNPNTYTFTGDEPKGWWPQVEAGETGTHFMSSYDNYAVPLLQQDKSGKMYFNPNASPSDKEAMKFNSEEDANYFAEHYKEIAPMMRNKQFKKGGKIPKYAMGSTIGGVLGAGVGALGFFAGPAVGLATTQLGAQLGAKVGSEYDTPDVLPKTIPLNRTFNGMKGYGNNNQIYAMGGTAMPNAEIEKQEVARTPQGQTVIADAPSHEQGGLQLNLPPGTEITSDRLINPITGNTFAKDQGSLERSKARASAVLKYRPNDKYAKKSIEILDKASQDVFDFQEQIKHVENTRRMFKNGGVVQYGLGGRAGDNRTTSMLNGSNELPEVLAQDNGNSDFNMSDIGLGIGLGNTGMQLMDTFNPEQIDRISNTQAQPAIDNYQGAINNQRSLRYNNADMLAENKASELNTNNYIDRNISNSSARMGNRLANRALSLNNTNRIYGDTNRANLGIQSQANQMQMGLSGMRADLGAQDAQYAMDYRNMNLQQRANLRKIRSQALGDYSNSFQAQGRDKELMDLLPLMYPAALLHK